MSGIGVDEVRGIEASRLLLTCLAVEMTLSASFFLFSGALMGVDVGVLDWDPMGVFDAFLLPALAEPAGRSISARNDTSSSSDSKAEALGSMISCIFGDSDVTDEC